MDSSLLEKIETLKKQIENNEDVILLKKIDKELSADENVMILSYKKDMALTEYEFALSHYKADSVEVSNAQKKLHEAKLELDNHPLVKKYNSCFSKVRLLYKQINDTLFGEFNYLGDRDCD